MANLVPLHIDKDTGKIIAKHTAGSGSGGSAVGYLFVQSPAANIWIIEHNAGSEQLICQIFDTVGELILPDRLSIIDINTVEIEFAAAMEGRAHLMFFNTV